MDTSSRDSLALDLMEAVRPQVDAYLFDWITREPLRREWFFEKSDGNCRLMGSFAARLTETALTYGRAVAPVAEWVSRILWSTLKKPSRQIYPATRLTQSRRRQARGGESIAPADPGHGHRAIAVRAVKPSSAEEAIAHPVLWPCPGAISSKPQN